MIQQTPATPAQRVGLVIGQKYLNNDSTSSRFGREVYFQRDDRSNNPYFSDTLGGDPTCCPNVDDVTPVHTFKFQIGDRVVVKQGQGIPRILKDGETYTVTKNVVVGRANRVHLNHSSDPDNTGSGYNESRFELAPKAPAKPQTPAEKLGYALGDRFLLDRKVGGTNGTFRAGDIITLHRDDRTDAPNFIKDGVTLYVRLEAVTKIVEGGEASSNIILQRTGKNVVLNVKADLTPNQVARIMQIVNE